MPTPDDRLEQLLVALGARVSEGDEVPSGRHRPGRPPLLSLPGSLTTARWAVNGAAVRGMVVVVVVLAAVLGVRVAWAERQAAPQPVPVAAQPETAATTATGPTPAAGAPTAAAASTEQTAGTPSPESPDVLLHVIGAVRRPGVVEVAAGSRVQDAVEAAGGLRADADLTRINLARVAGDGERLWVPVRGEEPPPDLPSVASTHAPTSAGVDGTPGGQEPQVDAVVDLNTADQAGLETLPGVGPVTAQRILAWRVEHGAFSAVEELLEVSGIGERTLDQLRPHVGLGP